MPYTKRRIEDASRRLADGERTVKDIAPVDKDAIRRELWTDRQRHTVKVSRKLLP